MELLYLTGFIIIDRDSHPRLSPLGEGGKEKAFRKYMRVSIEQ